MLWCWSWATAGRINTTQLKCMPSHVTSNLDHFQSITKVHNRWFESEGVIYLKCKNKASTQHFVNKRWTELSHAFSSDNPIQKIKLHNSVSMCNPTHSCTTAHIVDHASYIELKRAASSLTLYTENAYEKVGTEYAMIINQLLTLWPSFWSFVAILHSSKAHARDSPSIEGLFIELNKKASCYPERKKPDVQKNSFLQGRSWHQTIPKRAHLPNDIPFLAVLIIGALCLWIISGNKFSF